MATMLSVNSKNTVGEWRSAGALSEGASESLIQKLPKPFQDRKKDVSDSFVCSMVEDLMWAVTELTKDPQAVSIQQAEEWAIFLHNSLTHEMRAYHSIDHVFKICAGASPVQLLAAFFRDVISHFIEGMVVDARKQELIANVFEPGTLVLRKSFDNQCDLCIIRIFGHEPGMDLSPFKEALKGLDIFLSTILATRLLKDSIQLKHAAQLAVCLEATIPFRGPNENGEMPLEILYQRLKECIKHFNIEMTELETIEALQQATDLKNRSVGNMASADPAEFLDHAWRLLPERYAPLRQHAHYTLAEYYIAVHDLVQQIENLNPTMAFATFENIPTTDEVERFRSRLQANLDISRRYLQSRLLSIAIVSALAYLTGGDHAPKCFFFGDVPRITGETNLLGFGLIQNEGNVVGHDPVFDLLVTGEGLSLMSFDTKNAPLAAFLYRELGSDKVAELMKICDAPMDEKVAGELLRGIPFRVVEQIASELASVTITRQTFLSRLLDTIKCEAS